MLQSTTLDAYTMILQSDEESDMQDLLTLIKQKERAKKEKLLTSFLDFAKNNYETDPLFKFNREKLYN